MISIAKYSDIGKRPVNEDSILTVSDYNRLCCVVCDGLGGHGMGDVASQIAVTSFKSEFEKCNDFTQYISVGMMKAQTELLKEQKNQNAQSKMKTTAAVLLIDEKNTYVGHVGDSRVYFFKRNKMILRTLDHSVPQMLVLSKKIPESAIRNHADRSMLLRVLGEKWEEPKYELMQPFKLRKWDAALLCSDGFWELIDEKEMCEALKKSHSVEEWLELMNVYVRKRGAKSDMDNNSAIALWNR